MHIPSKHTHYQIYPSHSLSLPEQMCTLYLQLGPVPPTNVPPAPSLRELLKIYSCNWTYELQNTTALRATPDKYEDRISVVISTTCKRTQTNIYLSVKSSNLWINPKRDKPTNKIAIAREIFFLNGIQRRKK